MSSYILRKGRSVLADLADGAEAALPPMRGNVYYVNGFGVSVGGNETPNDSADGTFKSPLATITEALARCSNDRGDFILVSDYYQPSGETWPISVNKSLVSIIGLSSALGGSWGGFCPWPIIQTSGSNAAFDIVTMNVLIANLGIYAGTASQACITMDEGASVVRVDRCRFNQGTYGVHLTSGDTGYGIEITNCFFQNGLASGGIYFNDDPAHCLIQGNHFDRLAGPAISIVQGAGGRILDNYIGLAAGYSAGAGITLAAGVNRYYVDGNHASIGNVAGSSGNLPYVDAGTVATQNNWGLNYYGVTASQPT
jgi:hypothetical protein